MNPFDLRGPDFLRLYVIVFAAVMVVAGLLRWLLRLPAGDPELDSKQLSPCEIAYLAGGEKLAVNAAIARLVHDDALALDTSHVNLKTTAAGGAVTVASDVEGVIMATVEKSPMNQISIDTVLDEASDALEPVRDRLEELGFLVGDGQAVARFVPLAVALLVVVFGVIKIGVGVVRIKPVGFLAILCVISAVAALVCFARPVFRSRRGDRALAELKKSNSALKYQARSRLDDLAGDDVVMALGLFGMGLLAGSRIADLRTALRPLPSRGSSNWCGSAGCGSGCGGGGCGGGCGGGGCGGCGG